MYAIKCDSLTITYDRCGVAEITMTVYSNDSEFDLYALPDEYGGVKFKITDREVSNVQVNSGIYMYTITLKGTSEG